MKIVKFIGASFLLLIIAFQYLINKGLVNQITYLQDEIEYVTDNQREITERMTYINTNQEYIEQVLDWRCMTPHSFSVNKRPAGNRYY